MPFPYTPNAVLHPLRIGALKLDNNLVLAPMAGFTNLALRVIAKEEGGVGLVCSEMVAALAPAHRRQDHHFAPATASLPAERPILMQVYGREPERCAQTAADLQAAGADVVDLNCGCPVRKALAAGCGVALMREPQRIAAILTAMRQVLRVPMTVKIRLGADASSRNAVEIARLAVAAGVEAITVHARTGESRHGTAIDWSGLAAVKAAVPVPVLANGDLAQPDDILRCHQCCAADGFMIGRAACGNPWLFRNLIAVLGGGLTPAITPTPADRRRLLERHFDLLVQLFGEKRGPLIMRKYASCYCQGLSGVRAFRDRFVRITDRAGFQALVEGFFAAKSVRKDDPAD